MFTLAEPPKYVPLQDPPYDEQLDQPPPQYIGQTDQYPGHPQLELSVQSHPDEVYLPAPGICSMMTREMLTLRAFPAASCAISRAPNRCSGALEIAVESADSTAGGGGMSMTTSEATLRASTRARFVLSNAMSAL